MTPRDLGFVALKLMGLYFGLNAVLVVINYLVYLDVPTMEGFPSPKHIFISTVASASAMGVFAVVCLFWTDELARRLFPAEPSEQFSPQRRDLLSVGLVLLGAYIVLINASELVGFLLEAFWYLGAERQRLLPDFWSQTWQPLLESAVLVVLGLLLALYGVRSVRSQPSD